MTDSLISTLSAEDENKSYITTKIPPGGKEGNALVKASNKNYDVKWSSSSGVGGGCGCDRIPISDIIKLVNS